MANVLRDFFIINFAVYNAEIAVDRFRSLSQAIVGTQADIDRLTDTFSVFSAASGAYEQAMQRQADASRELESRGLGNLAQAMQRYSEVTGQVAKAEQRVAELRERLQDEADEAAKKSLTDQLKQASAVRSSWRDMQRGIRQSILEATGTASWRQLQRFLQSIEDTRQAASEAMQSLQKFGIKKESLNDLRKAREELEHLMATSQATQVTMRGLAFVALTAATALLFTFKQVYERFLELDRSIVQLQYSLGVSEHRAAAFARAFSAVGMNASAFANAMTQFQLRMLRSPQIPMLIARLGGDPGRLLTTNVLQFSQEMLRVAESLRRMPPIYRAVVAEIFGKDLFDMLQLMARYRVSDIAKEFEKIYSPELIAALRQTVTSMAILAANLTAFLVPMVQRMLTVFESLARGLNWLADVFHGWIGKIMTPFLNLAMFIGAAVAGAVMFTRAMVMLQNLWIVGTAAIRVAVTNVDVLNAALMRLGVALDTTADKALIASGAVAGTSVIATVGATMGGILSVVFAVLALLGLGGWVKSFWDSKQTQEQTRDYTAEIAANTSLANIYLSTIARDIRQMVQTTAVGGNVAPLYQILNMQLMAQQALWANTSAV